MLSRRNLLTAPVWLTVAAPGEAPHATDSTASVSQSATMREVAAAHVVNRLGFGPAPGQIDRVIERGPVNYITEQLNPGVIPQPEAFRKRLDSYPEINLTANQILDRYAQDGKIDDIKQLASLKNDKLNSPLIWLKHV